MLATLLALAAFGGAVRADMRVGDICRVKGQEENTLQGLGLVVGLKGTGDPDQATTQALAKILGHMGANLPKDEQGRDILTILKENKNVTLVFVTATVPRTGGSGGDLLDCTVSAIGKAKSLEGGTLLLTPLLGPRPGNQRVYAFAQGPVYLEDVTRPLNARVFKGCRLEEDFHNEFVKDGTVTLVVDREHAGFQTANEIAYVLNTQFERLLAGGGSKESLAIARDAVNIEVKVPPTYAAQPTEFVAQLLETRLFNPPSAARVVINRQTGTIVVGADVEIGPVMISHKNFNIETGGSVAGLDVAGAAGPTRLKSLVDALNALNATPQDLIDILQSVKEKGALYAQLIVQ
jgi:flagellar P-ring protein precursor FlgI